MVSFARPESLPNGKLDDLCCAGAFEEPSEELILFEGLKMEVPWNLIADTECWVPFRSPGTYTLAQKAVETNQRSKGIQATDSSKKRGHEDEA